MSQSFILGELKKVFTKAFSGKVKYDRFYFKSGILHQKPVVAAPEMGQILTQQNHVTWLEMVDVITYKLPSGSPYDVYQFYLRMIMPFVIKPRHHIVTNGK